MSSSRHPSRSDDASQPQAARFDRTQLLAQLAALNDRLTGTALPDLEFASYMAGSASLHGLARDCAAIYLYPGTDTSPLDGDDSLRNDTAQHRAFSAHDKLLHAVDCRAIGISTETPGKQSMTILRQEVSQELLSDPEARLADALGLPTFPTGTGGRAYHRLILVAKRRVIRRVLISLEPGRSGQEVHALLQASRKRDIDARRAAK